MLRSKEIRAGVRFVVILFCQELVKSAKSRKKKGRKGLGKTVDYETRITRCINHSVGRINN
jgi:hypothetical protein